MPEHHLKASEVDHSEVVFDVVLPPVHEATEVVHPSEEPLDFPSFPVAAQGAAILCFGTFAAVRRNHLDPVVLSQLPIEPVRVVGLVADQPCRELVEEASRERVFDEMALCR